jgi:uncharacterized membrane protein
VAAGPWLYTVLALILIGEFTLPLLGEEAVATFRVEVMYAFFLSLVAASPVIIVGVREFSDEVYRRRYGDVRTLYVATLAASCFLALVAATCTLSLLIDVERIAAIVGALSAGILSCTWVSVAFSSVLRDYRQLTFAFSVGLAVGAVLAISAARSGLGPTGMVGGFAVGFLVVFTWGSTRILATFDQPISGGARPTKVLLPLLKRHPALAFGGLASAAGIWVDKWVLWLSPHAETTASGFKYLPQYEAAMFVAALTLVPALALFVANLETTFFGRYRDYLEAVERHATLSRLEHLASGVETATTKSIASIITMQAAICGAVFLSAPAIVDRAGLHFAQIGTLRAALIGGLFHVAFVCCSSIVLFFDRSALYALLQVLFVVLVALMTWASALAGVDVLGLGYMFAAVIAACVAFVAFSATLRDANLLVFIGNANRQSG